MTAKQTNTLNQKGSRVFLLTGATGFIGSEFLRRLLTWDPDCQVILLLRKQTLKMANRFLSELFPRKPAIYKRIRLFQADMTKANLDLDSESCQYITQNITDIVHFAAAVQFNLSLTEARKINLEPTKNLYQLAYKAKQADVFRFFHYISTFAVGRPAENETLVKEIPPSLDTHFQNTYEQTKAEAELFLLSKSNEIPIGIYRMSIVCGDSRTGWTLKFDNLYFLIRVFISRLSHIMKSIPLPKDSSIDIVTIDYVCDALYVLIMKSILTEKTNNSKIYHITAGKNALPLATILKATFQYLQKELKPSKSFHIPPIQLIDRLSLSEIETELEKYGITKQTMIKNLLKLVPYLLENYLYDNTNLLNALKGTTIKPRLLHQHLEPILGYCIKSNWGEKPGPRPPLSDPPF